MKKISAESKMKKRALTVYRLLFHWSLGATIGATIANNRWTDISWFFLVIAMGAQIGAKIITYGTEKIK